MVRCSFIDRLVEFELPKGILLDIFTETELMDYRYGKISIVFDDLSEISCEPIKGLDLSPDQTSFFKIAVKHLPHVFFCHLRHSILSLMHYL